MIKRGLKRGLFSYNSYDSYELYFTKLSSRLFTRLFSILIVFLIIFILIIAGPANAMTIGFSISEKQVEKGEKIAFSISIDELDQEEINEIELSIGEQECKFDVNGEELENCEGIEITKTEVNYKYGYDYGQIESISFSVELDTSNFNPGIYQTQIKVSSNEGALSQKGEDILIKLKQITRCSVRAKDGNLSIGEKFFSSENSLSFYNSLRNAASGEGYLTSQSNKTRFAYDFKVVSSEIKDNKKIFYINGNYKVGTQVSPSEDGKIILEEGKINLISKNILLTNINVESMSGC
jgi:hypothetical protein